MRGTRWALATCLTILGGVMLTVGGGCQDPLFPEDAARSPYERYQALRGEAPPRYQRNAAGGREPALRERLRPLNQR